MSAGHFAARFATRSLVLALIAGAAWTAVTRAEEGTADFPELAYPDSESHLDSESTLIEMQFQEPLAPNIESQGESATLSDTARRASNQFAASIGSDSFDSSFLSTSYTLPAVDFASREQAFLRATSDAGDLLGSSPTVTSTGLQRRNPIVSDPRVRGSRVGSLAASGSYWVPARIDLDTMVSKFDSRIVEQVSVTPGPYTALSGPGHQFVDVQLLRAPRYRDGPYIEGETSFDYRSNGDQWHGRQSFAGGDKLWGFRAGYSHRTGSDYISGDGTMVPSSYNSREFDGALGAQLTQSSEIDFNYLRLDQTDVELAGQAFDIDWLVTDGYDVRYVQEETQLADRLAIEAWYNRTRFEGSAQSQGKRDQIPALDDLNLVAFTDVDSFSAGFRLAFIWDGTEGESLSAGVDLRYIDQTLNEITSGRFGFDIWNDANSPVPSSHASNPGLFAEYRNITGPTTVSAGGRIDWYATNLDASAAGIASVGILGLPATDFYGTEQIDQDDLLGMAFASFDHDLGEGWSLGGGVGYSERGPNLTERYAVQPFMFLLQNGLNTVTGDPLLRKERLVQTDLRLSRTGDIASWSCSAFHAWVNNYITFEATSAVPFPPLGQVEQINLRYVNTSLARLYGFEANGGVRLTQLVTGFTNLHYVEGVDETRNGSFSTTEASLGGPATTDPTGSRGDNVVASGLVGGANEPLPGILPLELRLGLRLEPQAAAPQWGGELSVRIVDNQNRVAASLGESITPGFTTWDLRGYYRPTRSTRLIAGVENLTDKNYREHLDFRSTRGVSVFRPGISGYFGAEVNY